ncbi:MBL fold metallo-hydrolase [Patescibacteria group bacterium]|nr:MBL fold metallo-hydrolase [Patescibacteria group bacterium]
MNISWLGHSCFKVEDKINGQSVTIITDPYGAELGLKVQKQKADLLTVSHSHPGHNNTDSVSGIETDGYLLFDRPGEYEAKGVFINGIGSYHDKKQGGERGKNIMFRLDLNGISILHAGDLGVVLSDFQVEKIGAIDILILPVGGGTTINAREAADIVKQIDPRIIIPMHYKIDGVDAELDGVEKFKKEMGGQAEELSKLKVSKRDLPEDEIKLIILAKA